MAARNTIHRKAILQQYIGDARKFSQLDRATEKILIRKAQEGSRAAMNRLISANLLFVIKIAYKYLNQGMELEDVISAGNLGLIEAAKRMDPERSNKFITYAVWWIRQSIRQAIFSQSRLIRLTANKEEKLRTLYKYALPMKNYPGGTSIDGEKIRDIFRKDSEEILSLLPFLEPFIHFDSPGSGQGPSIIETLSDGSIGPEDQLQQKQRDEKLYDAARCLNIRERQIINEYYGLKSGSESSLSQIAETFDLSKERVRQIKNRALKKLKQILCTKYKFAMAA